MTRDDIIRMALDAGFCHDINNGIYLCAPMHIERFAALVAAAEREECAKVCEADMERTSGYNGQWEGYGKFKTKMTGPECADAIRARGENE